MEIKNIKKKILSLKKKIKCPVCKKLANEPFIPFCSKKCSSIDLMKWLNDEYQTKIKTEE